ncbi:MAG: hypothetical protein GKR94_00715 [Gammaproteobacteria bacterium]|nr:hypothetical protein [Gammaproteobacteria bacterium]
MSISELIFQWAGLLLQGQVLAAVAGVIALLVFRNEVKLLLTALAERGGKFSAGPVSGELSAGTGEGSAPISQPPLAQEYARPESEQQQELERLAQRMEDIMSSGSKARSSLVDDIRKEHGAGWSWDVLSKSLATGRLSTRICAAALLTSIPAKMDAAAVAGRIVSDSSSLVRYRLLEALSYWLTTSVPDEHSSAAVLEVLRDYFEENPFVQRKQREALRLLRGHVR